MSPVVSPGYLVPRDVQTEYGFQTGITPNNPALGASFTRRTPGDFFEVYVAVRLVLVTSAAAANRLVLLQAIDGDGNTAFTLSGLTSETANNSWAYKFMV